jgi:hypothetical protein
VIRIDAHDPDRVSLEAPLKYPSCDRVSCGSNANGPQPGLRLPQAKLSRKSNQVAPGRIRRFESYMPAVSASVGTALAFQIASSSKT